MKEGGSVIRPLHWIVAASVFFLFVSSWWMLGLPLPSDNFTYREIPFQLHKNVGLSLFALVVLMLWIYWRRRGRELPANRKLVHGLMYFLLIAGCATGYMSSSYSGWATTFWWLVELPAWAAEDDSLNILWSDLHMWSCWALLITVGVHLGAALFHGFREDGEIGDMFELDPD